MTANRITNILVTGGAGYIGSVLVSMLAREIYPTGFNVRIIDNLTYKQTSVYELCGLSHVDFVCGDVTDLNFMMEHIDWADIIIPLAGLVGMPACNKNKMSANAVNKDAIENIVNYMSSDTKIIYPNTNSGYGIGQVENGVLCYCDEYTPLNPISEYGKTKIEVEKSILHAGGVAFRLATVFGLSPRMRLDLLVNDFVYKAMTDRYIVLFEAHFKRNYIHIKDVCRAFLYAIYHYSSMQGEAYNLGLDNANISKFELCGRIQKYIPDFCVTESEIHEDPDKRNYIVSNEKIKKAGFHTKYSLDCGIKELIEGYKILIHCNKNFTNQ